MKNSLYTLCYAAVLGSACAFLLTGAAMVAKPFREANADAEKKRNILSVLAVPVRDDISAKQLVQLFGSSVVDETTAGAEIYRYTPKPGTEGVETVAVAFEGPGLWGPIKGFLALHPDMRTIRGITFYQQEETPGLGGEIASAGFRQQFIGKSIVDQSGRAGIIISAAARNAPNGVAAITGATMTCDKVQLMLNNIIENIVTEKQSDGQ